MSLPLKPPTTFNLTDFNTRRRFPNNNGISRYYMGMPSKDGPASNRSDFGLGRKYYLQYKPPATTEELKAEFKTKNIGQQTSDTIVKTARQEAGKPIPQNSMDLYIQQKRLLAVGKGSIADREKNEPTQLKGGEDKNYKNQRVSHLKAGGSIAPSRTSSKAVGPSQPSIFARRTRR